MNLLAVFLNTSWDSQGVSIRIEIPFVGLEVGVEEWGGQGHHPRAEERPGGRGAPCHVCVRSRSTPHTPMILHFPWVLQESRLSIPPRSHVPTCKSRVKPSHRATKFVRCTLESHTITVNDLVLLACSPTMRENLIARMNDALPTRWQALFHLVLAAMS